MEYFIYKITNTINGKIYIGKTKNVAKRLAAHKTAAKRKSPKDYSYLHRAMNKHGVENFIIEILANFKNEEDCFLSEINYISLLKSTDRNIGYNLTLGGEGRSGAKHSEETKKKISDYVRLNPTTASFKKGNKPNPIGLAKSKEFNRKLSDAQITEIKILLQEKQKSQKEIALLFNVNQSVICRINRGSAHKDHTYKY
jgi:group I intron endonuclease